MVSGRRQPWRLADARRGGAPVAAQRRWPRIDAGLDALVPRTRWDRAQAFCHLRPGIRLLSWLLRALPGRSGPRQVPEHRISRAWWLPARPTCLSWSCSQAFQPHARCVPGPEDALTVFGDAPSTDW